MDSTPAAARSSTESLNESLAAEHEVAHLLTNPEVTMTPADHEHVDDLAFNCMIDATASTPPATTMPTTPSTTATPTATAESPSITSPMSGIQPPSPSPSPPPRWRAPRAPTHQSRGVSRATCHEMFCAIEKERELYAEAGGVPTFTHMSAAIEFAKQRNIALAFYLPSEMTANFPPAHPLVVHDKDEWSLSREKPDRSHLIVMIHFLYPYTAIRNASAQPNETLVACDTVVPPVNLKGKTLTAPRLPISGQYVRKGNASGMTTFSTTTGNTIVYEIMRNSSIAETPFMNWSSSRCRSQTLNASSMLDSGGQKIDFCVREKGEAEFHQYSFHYPDNNTGKIPKFMMVLQHSNLFNTSHVSFRVAFLIFIPVTAFGIRTRLRDDSPDDDGGDGGGGSDSGGDGGSGGGSDADGSHDPRKKSRPDPKGKGKGNGKKRSATSQNVDSNFLALSCSLDNKGDSQVQLLSAVATSNGVDRLLEELRLAEPKYDFELLTLNVDRFSLSSCLQHTTDEAVLSLPATDELLHMTAGDMIGMEDHEWVALLNAPHYANVRNFFIALRQGLDSALDAFNESPSNQSNAPASVDLDTDDYWSQYSAESTQPSTASRPVPKDEALFEVLKQLEGEGPPKRRVNILSPDSALLHGKDLQLVDKTQRVFTRTQVAYDTDSDVALSLFKPHNNFATVEALASAFAAFPNIEKRINSFAGESSTLEWKAFSRTSRWYCDIALLSETRDKNQPPSLNHIIIACVFIREDSSARFPKIYIKNSIPPVTISETS